MEASNDPIRQAVDVNADLAIYLGAPRRQIRSLFDKSINGLFAKSPNEIDSRLEVKALLLHDDNDHVVSVAFRRTKQS